MRAAIFIIGLAGVLTIPAAASANPEPPALYDARVLGLGGAIGPVVEGPTSAYHNPAGLAKVERLELSLSAAPMLVNLSAPFAGAGSEQETGYIFSPLGFLGVGFRVHERVTMGFAAYLSTAFGGKYAGVSRIGDCSLPEAEQVTCGNITPPSSQDVTFFVMEAAIPVAFNIRDNLRVGVSLRLPYGVQSVDASTQAFPGTYLRAEQSVKGMGIPGVHVGVQYEPIPELTLSASYRSKVRVHMEGTATTLGLSGTSETDYYMPHAFRVGAAYRLLDDRLRIIGELRIQLHHEANVSQTFHVDLGLPSGPIDTTAPFNWKNVYVGSLGFEFMATPAWPVRLGLTVGNSATPASTVTPFMPPPEPAPAVYVGSGYHAETWFLDASFGVSAGRPFTIDAPGPNCVDPTAATPGGCDGTYQPTTLFAGLTFQYMLPGNFKGRDAAATAGSPSVLRGRGAEAR